MTKRPNQFQLDHDHSGATDYKGRLNSEEGEDRDTEGLPGSEATSDTPNEAMETTRKASEEGRRAELERARKVKDGDPDRDPDSDKEAS